MVCMILVSAGGIFVQMPSCCPMFFQLRSTSPELLGLRCHPYFILIRDPVTPLRAYT